MKPRFFSSPEGFRAWLEKNGAAKTELLLGFYKKGARERGITYFEAVDEALCFGWIDGVRRALDEQSYTIRFTPRRTSSIWSLVNVRKVEALKTAGRMRQPGLAAFAARDEKKTGIYSFEREHAVLDVESEKRFRADAKAWRNFEAQPPWVRRVSLHWVTSAKKEETRQRRLQTLIDCSRRGERIGLLTQSPAALRER